MKNTLGLILFSLITSSAYGQEPVLGEGGYNRFNLSPRGMITSFAPAPEETTTSVYLDENWKIGNIFLKDSTRFEDLNVKIDVAEDVLNIQYQGDVKILPFSQLLAVTFPTGDGNEDVYVNGKLLFGDSYPLNKLFHVLSEGEVSLYSTSDAEITEAYANPALSLDLDDKVTLKREYLIIFNGNFVTVESKSKLKKDLSRIFGEDIKSLFKKVNTRKEEDLLVLIKRLNDYLVKQG